jgi:hypothetical protein
MNILGYVSFILLTIGIVFQIYFSNWFFDEKIRQNFEGFFQNDSALQKEYVEKIFEKIPSKAKPKSPPSFSGTVPLKRLSYKNEITPYCMRLNLYPLLEAKEYKDHFLYPIFSKLITDLYKDILLTEKDISLFVDEFLKLLKEKKLLSENVSLTQVKFKQAAFQKAYYKMLKSNKSLLQYIKIKKGEKTCLSCCDYSLLKAIFNAEIAEKYVNKQNPLERALIDRQDLARLCSIYRIQPIDFSYFETKHRKSLDKEMTITISDERTGIQTNQAFSTHFSGQKLEK